MDEQPNMMLGPGPAPANKPDAEMISKALESVSYVNAGMRQLLMMPKVSRKDVFDLASMLVEGGAVTAQQAATQLAELPKSSEMIKPWLFVRFKETEGQMGQLAELLGQIEPPMQEEAVMLPPAMMGGAQPPMMPEEAAEMMPARSGANPIIG